jgi:hypothetical protein
MDIIKANTDGGHLPYTHVAQQQQNAQGAMLRMALIGAIALLLTVNLTYFVKTNARIDALAASTAGGVRSGCCRTTGEGARAPRVCAGEPCAFQSSPALVRCCACCHQAQALQSTPTAYQAAAQRAPSGSQQAAQQAARSWTAAAPARQRSRRL